MPQHAVSQKAKQRLKTEKRILEAAAAIFSEDGFAGARMDAIAKRASVNKATIYYHIGNKKALYARVLHDVFSGTVDTIERRLAKSSSPEEKLRIYVRGLILKIEANPHVPRIMMRELATGGTHLPDDAVDDFVNMFAMLSRIMDEGVRMDRFHETFPPLLHLMTVGTAILVKNLRNLSGRHADIRRVQDLERFLAENAKEEIEKLVLRAVMKPIPD